MAEWSKKIKLTIFLAAAACSFVFGYAEVADAALAAGRDPWRGYFNNTLDAWGTSVLPNGLHSNNVNELVSDIRNLLNSGSAQEKTGASFIVNTMIGAPDGSRNKRVSPGDGVTTYGDAKFREWEQRVRYAANRGWVQFNTEAQYVVNTYWQGTGSGTNPDDDAFNEDAGTSAAIVFDWPGEGLYKIRRYCGNPVGMPGALPDPDYNVSGYVVGIAANGARTTGSRDPYANDKTIVVQRGDSVSMEYHIDNAGPDAVNVTWKARNVADKDNPLRSGVNGLSSGEHNLVYTERMVVPSNAADGTKWCRDVAYAPNTPSDPSYASGDVCFSVSVPGGGGGGGGGGGDDDDGGGDDDPDIPTPAPDPIVDEDDTPPPTNRSGFDLYPLIVMQVRDVQTNTYYNSPTALVGDQVRFLYRVDNRRGDPSRMTTCTIKSLNIVGGTGTIADEDIDFSDATDGPATTCPRVMTSGTTTIATETFVIEDANRSFCRQLSITPIRTGSNGTRHVESCMRSVSRPYLKVYGGDVSVGGRFLNPAATTPCGAPSTSSIQSWTIPRRSFAGASTQYAAFASGPVRGFASAYGNEGGAPTPSGLTFSNTISTTAALGGYFSGGITCIPDYNGAMPSSGLSSISALEPLTDVDLGSLNSGVYVVSTSARSRNLLLHGNLPAGKSIVIYSDLKTTVTGDIKYTGAWNHSNVPKFKLVVYGSTLDIHQSVSRIDGIYVSQKDEHPAANDNGAINTCSLSNPVYAYNNCRDNRLTVNGAMIGSTLVPLRAYGSIQESMSNEPSETSRAAEVFNYNPAIWITQPMGSEITRPGNRYDAITSLPPIL